MGNQRYASYIQLARHAPKTIPLESLDVEADDTLTPHWMNCPRRNAHHDLYMQEVVVESNDQLLMSSLCSSPKPMRVR